jgi:hypothetical protein
VQSEVCEREPIVEGHRIDFDLWVEQKPQDEPELGSLRHEAPDAQEGGERPAADGWRSPSEISPRG